MPELVNTGVWTHGRLCRYLQSDELGSQPVHGGTPPPHTNARNAFYINVKKNIIGAFHSCYQIIETMVSKEDSLGISCWKKDKAGTNQREFVSQGEMSHSSDNWLARVSSDGLSLLWTWTT